LGVRARRAEADIGGRVINVSLEFEEPGVAPSILEFLHLQI
jgi:hypothetical protein